ncbi:phage terminase family protein [Acaricomes phytoseiuli]|uniref:phage terminase family protein n=1 Tax=Acaricomes phytoseiuli TaxID=291968 RepID=UPI002222890D|nr:phage terminase family protein [Acaricomes phytoseiuli]MCW1249653.1 phage terminase family protein [Acaricomes phytoseiuli]
MNSKRSGQKRLLGVAEPRIFTPPLRELTPETSLGFECIEFAEKALGRVLYPWQRWFLIHSMELAPGSFASDEFPVFRFRTVLLLVARQNGKSTVMSVRLLWRMFMWQGPEVEPPLILGTAHKLGAAEEILDLAYSTITRSPELAEMISRRSRVNGDKNFELTNGARYKCEAASDDGGRALSVTDLGFDELRQQRTWDAWSALTNTTAARFSSQVLGVSNAGDSRSVVLKALRAKALKELESPETEFGFFEYSAPDDCNILDREGWAQANPSLGHSSALSEKTLAATAALVGADGDDGVPEHKFRTETLCQWVLAASDGPFTEEQLEACTDAGSSIAEDSPIVLAVDTSADRSMTHLAVAGWREDGLPHVEVITSRSYTEWVARVVSEGLDFAPDLVVVQGRGAPATPLIEALEDAGVEVTKCQQSDLTNSCSQMADRIVSGSVRWLPQPNLTIAAREVVQHHLGDVWVWDRKKSPVDVSPLCAVTFALWGLARVERKTAVSTAYGEDYEKWW